MLYNAAEIENTKQLLYEINIDSEEVGGFLARDAVRLSSQPERVNDLVTVLEFLNKGRFHEYPTVRGPAYNLLINSAKDDHLPPKVVDLLKSIYRESIIIPTIKAPTRKTVPIEPAKTAVKTKASGEEIPVKDDTFSYKSHTYKIETEGKGQLQKIKLVREDGTSVIIDYGEKSRPTSIHVDKDGIFNSSYTTQRTVDDKAKKIQVSNRSVDLDKFNIEAEFVGSPNRLYKIKMVKKSMR